MKTYAAVALVFALVAAVEISDRQPEKHWYEVALGAAIIGGGWPFFAAFETLVRQPHHICTEGP